VFSGFIIPPGSKRIQVDFECRKGATEEEKDLAFLMAIHEVTDAGYLPLGEYQTDSSSRCGNIGGVVGGLMG
jgi:hypothetical protein